ncbi:MAG: trigger factor [Candidatus Dojkabacteria bacterium]
MENFYERKDIDKSTIEIKITVPKDSFQKSYETLLNEELKKTNIKGFRKGKVPVDLIEPEMGNTIKIQAFEKLVPLYITTALQKENLNPIAPPIYKDFPDFSKDVDLVFTMDVTIMPEFKLGNLKKIKIDKEEVKISKKEIEDALESIKKNNETKTKDINEEWAKEIIEKLKIEDIKDLKSLKKYIEETLQKQKEHMMAHKREDEAFEQAIKLSNIEVPQAATKYEAEERERAFVHDMEHKNIKVDDFLKANNITLEKMRELWLKDAQQALESDVFLKLYSKDRNIKVTDEDLKTKIDELKKNAPKDTDPQIFENEEWKEYIRRIEEKERAFREFTKEILGE